jgi:hypothetical protein
VKEKLYGDNYEDTCLNGILIAGILEHVKSRIFRTLEELQKKNKDNPQEAKAK